jgi:hypothetical protein
MQDNGYSPNTNQDDLDYVAQDAGEGAFETDIGSNSVTVVFERSDGDAKRTEAAYKVFGAAFDTPVEDILHRAGSVVVVWDKTPSDSEEQQLADCL